MYRSSLAIKNELEKLGKRGSELLMDETVLKFITNRPADRNIRCYTSVS